MNQVFSGYMGGVFSAGMLCTIALMLAGDGARREVVRLCCACVMMVVILTPIARGDFSIDSLLQEGSGVEQSVDEALQEAKTYEYSAIAANIASYIETEAQAMGIDCQAVLDYTVSAEQVFTIGQITVRHDGETPQTLQALQHRIVQDCGVAAEQIVFLERDA